MSRRSLWTLITAISICVAGARAQVPESFPSATQYTGAAELFVSGKAPKQKTAEEIIALAKTTKFYEKGQTVAHFETGGSIEYVPREFLPNALEHAITEGLVLNKFTVVGKLPARIRLDPGTYYTFLDFVGGRWVARVISMQSAVSCFVWGVELKQVVAFGEGHREAHSQPRIILHGTGLDEAISGGGGDGGQSPRPRPPAPGWEEQTVDWKEVGAACVSIVVCAPTT